VRLKERRLGEQNATDLVRRRLRSIVDPGPNAADSLTHGLECRASILRFKRLPGEPVRQPRVAREIRESADRVPITRFQLEEKRRSDLASKTPVSGGRPEVNFVEFILADQEFVPTVVGNGNCAVHRADNMLAELVSKNAVLVGQSEPDVS